MLHAEPQYINCIFFFFQIYIYRFVRYKKMYGTCLEDLPATVLIMRNKYKNSDKDEKVRCVKMKICIWFPCKHIHPHIHVLFVLKYWLITFGNLQCSLCSLLFWNLPFLSSWQPDPIFLSFKNGNCELRRHARE